MKDFTKYRHMLGAMLLFLGIVLTVIGLIQGEDSVMRSKTSLVCLSCIGLG